MKPVVRFAPSPTGNIHIGNARTALINWIYAKQNGGDLILRLDDTDTARSRQEYADNIAADIRWLGIEPARTEKQSSRFEQYGIATQKLKDAGLLYACYETADELDRQRKRLAMRGKPPVYDRSALKYSDEDLAKFKEEGRTAHWRFLLPNFESDPFAPKRTDVSWTDLVKGDVSIDLASMSDPVLIREDGTWLYTLPSVVDDIEMGVTHIIRGDDHVTNSGAQIAVFEALGATPPSFGHHNFLTSITGEAFSKRLGSMSLQSLAQEGFEPMAVASVATLIGTSGPVEAMPDMQALIEKFDIKSITKSAAKFDPAEVGVINAKLVHDFDYDLVKDRLEADGVGGGAVFWNAVKGNISKVNEAKDWWSKIQNATPVIEDEDKEFIAAAASMLPQEPWDENTWGELTNALKAETGRKGKNLFMPLRKAITGEAHGPELAILLPIIGREKTLARLS
ncbi:MAG: glutamate--tRNA ligase [Nitratireductor sp.]